MTRRVSYCPLYRHKAPAPDQLPPDAVAADGRWNADVRLRRLFTEDKPQLERVTCYKLTAEHAERSAEIWARRWIDGQRGE